MKKLSVKQASGFVTSDKKIRILDANRKPFYFFDTKNDRTEFNLPKGVYLTENDIKGLPEKIKFKTPVLKPERKISIPKKIKFIWGQNPNKASVILNKGIILVDEGFKQFPRFVQVYLFYHEIGHYFFKSEKGADSFARVQMLKRGFNPSQVGMASRISLSPKSVHRVKACFEDLHKTKKI